MKSAFIALAKIFALAANYGFPPGVSKGDGCFGLGAVVGGFGQIATFAKSHRNPNKTE
ncbi:hypothetical protein [Cochlodiniinecator piscidefendens]|uniref:hypothetical protein n=1 Tax=Cochlodiniinecator piscidefendens TaxID=2715756 RepID=UPI00140C867D|nr:hypothetical protein [Cochlodiniinecator piscidefendens]